MSRRVQRHVEKGRPSLAVADLVSKPILQALQDRFSEKYRVPTAILDKSANPITFERRQNAYCKEIRKTLAGYTLCRNCDKKLIAAVSRTGQQWAICYHGGLLDFAAPLCVRDKIMAFFFIGQIRGRRGKKSTDGISKYYQHLRKEVEKKGEEKKLTYTSLKTKFARIPRRRKEQIETLEAAAVEFAEDLSRTLTKLEEWHRPYAVSQFVTKLARATDMDTLFDVCVSEIPTLLGTKYCSILTVVHRTRRGLPRLVLRKTNYSQSKHLEGTKAYRMGQGLTGWVWKNARSLRLDNIEDESELKKYPGLIWTNTICDSDHHREWLGVPLYGWQGDVIGMIRVPEKARTGKASGGGFTFEDEVLLLKIGQYVARQIEEISAGERIGTALRASQECAVRLCHAVDRKSVGEILVATCKQIFGTTGKLHAFIMLAEDSRTFGIEVSGGSLGGKHLGKIVFPIDESLGGLALRQGRAVIVHDMERAGRHKRYYPAVPALACAMSAPICFGEKKYGIFSVGADRKYEFSEEPDLHILEDLSSIAGATLARLDAEKESKAAFVEFSGRMGHTLNSRIAMLEGTIAGIEGKKSSKRLKEITKIKQVVEFLKATANLAIQFGEPWDRVKFCKFDLAAKVKSMKALWGNPRIRLSVKEPLEMIGDPELLEHMLLELVGNSLRFVPKHNGVVIIDGYRQRSRRGTFQTRAVVIEVKDNGPGVPESDKESIFVLT